MTDEEAIKIVKAAMVELGLDANDPREMQADFVFLRNQREGSEQVGRYVKLALYGGVITAGLTALWWGIQVAFNAGPGPHP